MGLIVVLGAIGIVNGLWSKNLVINGTVETGDLNADWDCAYTNDDAENFDPPSEGPCSTVTAETGDTGLDPDNWDWPLFNDWDHPLKNVGRCTVEIDDPDLEPYGAQVAHVLIENAYPSYECTITLFLSNTGTIPFNLIGSEFLVKAGDEIGIEGLSSIEGEEDCVFDGVSPQVDPGQEKRIDCTVHVKQTAEQNDCEGNGLFTTADWDWLCVNSPLVDYEFGLMVCVAQWNEDPSTGVNPVTPPTNDFFDEDDYAICKNPSELGPYGGTHEGPTQLGQDNIHP
jgi:hypothetical protein